MATPGMKSMEDSATNHPKNSAHAGYLYVPYDIPLHWMQLKMKIPAIMAGEQNFQQKHHHNPGRKPTIFSMSRENLSEPYTQPSVNVSKKARNKSDIPPAWKSSKFRTYAPPCQKSE